MARLYLCNFVLVFTSNYGFSLYERMSWTRLPFVIVAGVIGAYDITSAYRRASIDTDIRFISASHIAPADRYDIAIIGAGIGR